MASVRFIEGKGYRVEWCVTIKHGIHAGKRKRGSRLFSCKKKTPRIEILANDFKTAIEHDAKALASGLTEPLKTWCDFVSEFRKTKTGYKTVDEMVGRLEDLGEYSGLKYIEHFNASSIIDYINHRREDGASENTVRKILQVFSSAMTLAIKRKYLKENPFATDEIVLPPKPEARDRFLTRNEFACFLQSCRNLPGDRQYRGKESNAITFMWHCIFIVNTGLRITEYITAKKRYWIGNKLTVYGKGKRGKLKRRTVPLNNKAIKALEYLTEANPGKDDLLFGYCNRRSWYGKYQRWFALSGIKDIGPHVLRRTFGSWLAMAGEPLPNIKELMGHANIQTTIDHYAHLAPGYLAGSTKNMRYHDLRRR